MKQRNKIDTFRRFADVVRGVDGWKRIDEFLAICDDGGVFDHADQEEMIQRYKKSAIRQMLRRMSSKAIEGVEDQIEWVNIIIQSPSGEREQVYKNLTLFDEGDFVQVVRDRVSRRDYWGREIERFVKLATEKFGPRIQDMLPFVQQQSAA